MPKMRDRRSQASSRSAPSSLGSIYRVDCAFLKVKLPAPYNRRLIFFSRISSKVLRLRPLQGQFSVFNKKDFLVFHARLFFSFSVIALAGNPVIPRPAAAPSSVPAQP